jgi:coenzyme F420 hydrogenase subunit beta
MEQEMMHGVLHIGPDMRSPHKNRTVLSKNRADILSRTGSRYSPASPCDSLGLIESAPDKCVFVGKPCDLAAVRKASALRPGLDRNIGLTVGIFCAGTPATQGTLDLLAEIKVKTEDVEEIRYRGRGWPGKFSVRVRGEEQPRELLTYMDAWGFVQKYRPYRCYLCPDGTSEFADISCGDPWYRPVEEGEQGYSMVLVRTERGRRILEGARNAGYISIERADPAILEASQKNLLAKRSAVWGRLLALRAFGIPSPQLKGFFLFRNWLGVPAAEKLRSVAGTTRRIVQRKYYKRMKYSEYKNS